MDYGYEFELQLGVESDGEVFGTCPYEECDGGLLDFWWWEAFRGTQDAAPEVPIEGKVYPLYPPEPPKESGS
ncbi:MAG: hypothetical protein QF672_13095 [SAR202 cluster bacterium]|nr:hypothetical protein [SAR202 cluster bacterium]